MNEVNAPISIPPTARASGWLRDMQRLLEIDQADLLAAQSRHDALFDHLPQTLNSNVTASATLLGLSKAQFVAAALKQPQLFYQRPQTLDGNVTASATLLGLSKAQFVAAALKQPPLFYQRPEKLDGNVTASATLLGLSKAQFVAAALKQASLFYLRPQTLDGNVTASATLLGLSKAQFVTAALKQPPLFCQRPEKLDGNVTASATLLGLSKAQFVAAALKQPQLFCQRPQTLDGKKPYLKKIIEALNDQGGFQNLIEKYPVGLCYSHHKLHASYILAKAVLKKGKPGSLIVMPAAKTSALIRDHFTRQIAATGRGRRALQVMHAQGLIDALPDFIAPLVRPARRPRHPGAASKGL